MKIYQLFILSAMLLAPPMMVSCNKQKPKAFEQGKPTGREASATLNPTQDSTVHGTVKFIELDPGVRIIADIQGLTPGEHGFHIHEFGDCSAPDGSSAGGHFNPTHDIHAGPDDLPRHVGDLGNVKADKNGKAHYERVDFVITFSGDHSIIGKSVIIHQNKDDFISQPTGNAGAKVACGVIKMDEEKE